MERLELVMVDEQFSRAREAVLSEYGLAAEERWIETPITGGKAHVLVAGDGPPVVLLNGIGVPAAMWAPLMARIGGVTQYAIDLPAFGLSDTSADFADDLRADAFGFGCRDDWVDGIGFNREQIARLIFAE